MVGRNLVVVSLIWALLPLNAQTAPKETVLYRFTGGADGSTPAAGLILGPAGDLTGTSTAGGTYGGGTVFRLTPPAWDETALYSFMAGSNGYSPWAGVLADSKGNLYGTDMLGGVNNAGTVFKLAASKKIPWAEAVIHRFSTYAGGYEPSANLAADAKGNLFGIAREGGGAGDGAAFELLAPTGSATKWTEKAIHIFMGGSDGAYPGEPFAVGGLVGDSQGHLYGATYGGGSTGNGTVFRLTPPKSGETNWAMRVLYSFAGGTDGANPQATLYRDSGGNLYGTTHFGGSTGAGTVFKVAVPAAGSSTWTETVLFSFTGGTGNGDGAYPTSPLIAGKNGRLIGTTDGGGGSSACAYGGCGTVFELIPPSTVGAPWTENVIYAFQGGTDGADPSAGVIANKAGDLFGTTSFGGKGYGTVFEITQ